VLEQVQGALAVPVRVGREVKAVFDGWARTMDPLGDRVLDTAAALAASVGRELTVEIELTPAPSGHRSRARATRASPVRG